MQICANVSEKEYTEIMRQAQEDGTSKGKKAADLITYALAGGEKDEVARVQREVAHRDEMLSALKEELGFMRMAFQTLEREIAAPLAMLAEPVKKKHWWQRV